MSFIFVILALVTIGGILSLRYADKSPRSTGLRVSAPYKIETPSQPNPSGGGGSTAGSDVKK